MRSNSYLLLLFVALSLGFVACKSNDSKTNETKAPDMEAESAIEDMLAQEQSKTANNWSRSDSAIINAYKEDKTKITINDLGRDDTTYSMMVKNLYRSASNEKYALVIGLRKNKKMGLVIVQKEGEEALKLPQTKDIDGVNMVFAEGNNTLELNGTEAILHKGGKTVNLKIVQ